MEGVGLGGSGRVVRRTACGLGAGGSVWLAAKALARQGPHAHSQGAAAVVAGFRPTIPRGMSHGLRPRGRGRAALTHARMPPRRFAASLPSASSRWAYCPERYPAVQLHTTCGRARGVGAWPPCAARAEEGGGAGGAGAHTPGGRTPGQPKMHFVRCLPGPGCRAGGEPVDVCARWLKPVFSCGSPQSPTTQAPTW